LFDVLSGPSGFTLIFGEGAALACQKYTTPLLNDTLIKNVQLILSDMTIVAETSFALFNGSCNFTLQVWLLTSELLKNFLIEHFY